MIHSKSQKSKKIVLTDDERLFYTCVKPAEEECISQNGNEEIRNLLKTCSNKKPTLKKEPSYEYKIGNYLIQQTLGQGTFGKVKLGIYIPTQDKVAIKILEKERIKDKDDQIRVKREFDMLSKFNHPNVILVNEIFESVDSYYSVMEFCEGGELFNYIVDKKRLSENESSFFYFQIINGLEYIHSLGIVHRDLKPENLLLTKDHLLKIIDFGLSNYFVDGQEELLSTPCGSPCYASPEMVSGKKYNGIKIDIWATGIILFAMLCGYLPFENKDNEILFDQILECKVEFPQYLSEESKDLISKILVVDPETRIDIPGIKKHSFFLKGKNFFEQIFTIRKIYNDENENEIRNRNDSENNYENDNNEVSNEMEINEENKNKDEAEIEVSENKENINHENFVINNNKDEEILEKNNDESKKMVNNDKKYKKYKIKNKNDSLNKKSKDLNHKNLRQKDKKKKINITDDNKNQIGYNKKKLSDLIPNNYNRKIFQKTPEKKKRKKIKLKESTIDKTQQLDSIPKERNTAFTFKGSSLIDHFNGDINQTNLTNLMNKNMNCNVNVSFDNTKRTFSHENTKDDIIQNKQSINNNINNPIFHSRTNKNQNKNDESKKNNSIIIVDKILTITNDSNKYENKNNYLFNYNNKRYKNNIINNKYPKKINENMNGNKIIKHSFNSDGVKMKNQDFRICKFLESDSNIKKDYKEFLHKEYGDSNIKYNKNTLNNNNSVLKSKNSKYYYSYKNHTISCNSKSKDKQISINKTNEINNNKENNLYIGEKKNFKKIQNYKKLKINSILTYNDKSILKNKFISTTSNNSKKKPKILFNKSSNHNNKNNSKRMSKLLNNNFNNQNSVEISDSYTSTKIKNILAKKYRKKTSSQLNSRTENKTMYPFNQNIKYSMNTLRKYPIYSHHYSYKINSPSRIGKYNQKVIKNNLNNKLINCSFKKHFDSNNNIVKSFKMNKPDLVGVINKTNQKKNEPQNKKDIRDEISCNKLIEKNSTSLEINKNNTENEKQNSQSGISCIYNLSNDTLYNHLKNNDRKSSINNNKENNLTKNKNYIKNKKNKNICSEFGYDYEKNKILEMNKFRNLCIKTSSHLKKVKNDSKNYHTKSGRRESHLNNYKGNILKLERNISEKNLENIKNNLNVIYYKDKNNNKYKSMKINDIYKNNTKNKNKLKNVYLIDSNKNNGDEKRITENNKNSLTNKILFQRHIISIENYDSNGNISIRYIIRENNLSKKIRKQNEK